MTTTKQAYVTLQVHTPKEAPKVATSSYSQPQVCGSTGCKMEIREGVSCYGTCEYHDNHLHQKGS